MHTTMYAYSTGSNDKQNQFCGQVQSTCFNKEFLITSSNDKSFHSEPRRHGQQLLLVSSAEEHAEELAVQHKPRISDSDWEKTERYFSDILTTRDSRKLTCFV
eukprot:scpid92720/ scgid33533/ 